MPLDPEDVKARFDSLQFVAKVHEVHEPNNHHGCLGIVQLLLQDAEEVYKWLAHGEESPTRLIIWASDPYEQGNPAPDNQEGVESVAISLSDTQQVDLNVQPVDSKGQATDDPNLSWSVDDESVATLTVDPADPKHVTVVAGDPGVATVTVTDGTITGAEAVTVTAGAAASFNLVAGDPVEQPAAAGPTP